MLVVASFSTNLTKYFDEVKTLVVRVWFQPVRNPQRFAKHCLAGGYVGAIGPSGLQSDEMVDNVLSWSEAFPMGQIEV